MPVNPPYPRGVFRSTQSGRLPLYHPGAKPWCGEGQPPPQLCDCGYSRFDRRRLRRSGPGYSFSKAPNPLSYPLAPGGYKIPPIDGTDPLENARAIINELEKFSPTLAERERWLVLNKADLIDAEEAEPSRIR